MDYITFYFERLPLLFFALVGEFFNRRTTEVASETMALAQNFLTI